MIYDTTGIQKNHKKMLLMVIYQQIGNLEVNKFLETDNYQGWITRNKRYKQIYNYWDTQDGSTACQPRKAQDHWVSLENST